MTDFKAMSERLASLADDGDYTIQWEDEGRQLLTDDEIDGLRQAARLIAGMGDGVLVPREPTQEMFLAAERAGVSFATQQKCWAAMLAASPFAAAQEGAG